MKPQRVLNDGQTEANALLFAHDAKMAQENLLYQYIGEEEMVYDEKLKKKHQGFIDFVIKDLLDSIDTESAVFLEFMDSSDRNSTYKYAKAEEIEEIIVED